MAGRSKTKEIISFIPLYNHTSKNIKLSNSACEGADFVNLRALFDLRRNNFASPNYMHKRQQMHFNEHFKADTDSYHTEKFHLSTDICVLFDTPGTVSFFLSFEKNTVLRQEKYINTLPTTLI